MKLAATAGAATAFYKTFWAERAWAFAQSPANIRKFITTLPGLGPGRANNIGQDIPLATKTTQTFAGLATDVYNIGAKPFGERMHPDLPGPTHFWSYYDLASGDQKYLAGVIVAKRGTPVLLNVTNQVPNKALIPIDLTLSAGPGNLTVGDFSFCTAMRPRRSQAAIRAMTTSPATRTRLLPAARRPRWPVLVRTPER